MYLVNRRTIDPFYNLRRLSSVLDEAFSSENGAITAAWSPACDVFEDKESVKIVAELPGVQASDVKISLENNTLSLRGEKRQEAESSTDRVHRYERSYGAFERTFVLPSTVDPDLIEASYTDGLLTVTVPKIERARPREIEVKVGARQELGQRKEVGAGA